MPRNIEIKARLDDPAATRGRIEEVAGESLGVWRQRDVFFRSPWGKLKLRFSSHGNGELIYYRRPNRAGPCLSEYRIAPVENPRAVLEVLEAALGAAGTVRKMRRLYKLGQTRIHLDEVEGLGAFLELEVVLREGQDSQEGGEIARQLLSRLGIPQRQLVEAAYVDLLRGEE